MPLYPHHSTSPVHDLCSQGPPIRSSRELRGKPLSVPTLTMVSGRGITWSVSSELSEHCRRHGVPLHRRLARSTPVQPQRTPCFGSGRRVLYISTLTDWKRRRFVGSWRKRQRRRELSGVCKYSEQGTAYRGICTFLPPGDLPPPRCDYT